MSNCIISFRNILNTQFEMTNDLQTYILCINYNSKIISVLTKVPASFYFTLLCIHLLKLDFNTSPALIKVHRTKLCSSEVLFKPTVGYLPQ